MRVVFAFFLSLAACGMDEIPPIHDQPDAGLSQDDAAVAARITEISCAGTTLAGRVVIDDMMYKPETISIDDGDILQWVNQDNRDHTVTSGAPEADNAGELFDSGALATGDVFCLQFEGAAKYTYFCRFHSDEMRDATVTIH
ncbi:MAG TPA: plastocyanin/azurin family copper-binding protein [Kofleriaceae bacterium]|jgi:plastocyanin|nr:plastocyanin/azurin family copper-binding protein [Kofleriaceae bacterium]